MSTERITATTAALITSVAAIASISMVAYTVSVAESKDATLIACLFVFVALTVCWAILRTQSTTLHVFLAGIWHSIAWAIVGFLFAIVFVNLEADGDMLFGFYLVGLFAGGLAGVVYGCVLASRLRSALPSRSVAGAAGAIAALVAWTVVVIASCTVDPSGGGIPIRSLVMLMAHMVPAGTLVGVILRSRRTIWDKSNEVNR